MAMRRSTSWTAVGAVLVAAGAAWLPALPAASQAPAEPFSLRMDVRGVDLWVGISDRRGRPVAAADIASVSVLEDGRPQAIDAVYPAAELPLNLALVLDTSPTMTAGDAIGAAESDLRRFLDQTLRNEDRGALFTFRHQVVEKVPFGAGFDALHAAVSQAVRTAERPTFEGTAVRDAVAAVIERMERLPGRRAIVVVTDGRDTASELAADRLIRRARQSRVRLYGLMVGKRQIATDLDAVARATGGRLLRAREIAMVSSALRTVRRDLTDHWIVSYRSDRAEQAGCRAIALEALGAERRLQVRSPSGYCPSSGD